MHLDDKLIHYGICDCFVWPMSTIDKYGSCGRCGTRPFSFYPEYNDALNKFYALNGHVPISMGFKDYKPKARIHADC